MAAPPSEKRRMLLELDDYYPPGYEGPKSVRRIKDPVHDYITFGRTICAIVDTPQFQRLRNIKQLGTSYYVWPSACHNRFEHCLGVAYLAQNLATRLKDSQPSLGITRRDVQCVTIAGLCHDLGHGPWSHVWDSMYIPSIFPDKKWCHEDASNMMFDALLEENGLELHVDDAKFIKALIIGDRSMCRPDEKPYLFQIVANKTNGLDVDKFDYIARDSRAIDQKSNLSPTRLIHSARVVGNEICYDIKDAHHVFELCHTRMSLHKQIYTHKAARAIEYMIVDALTLAEPVMNIARRLENPKKYLYLTDAIMEQIEASEDPRLEPAQAIFYRIRTRDLYKSVDLKVFHWDMKPKIKAAFTPDSIVGAVKRLYANRSALAPEEAEGLDEVSPEDVAALGAENVIIDLTERHHGMKNENPLDFIRFYSKHNPDLGIRAETDDVSVTLPATFGELMLRVYTRDPRFFGLVQRGYREVLRAFTEREARLAEEDPLEMEVSLDERPVRAAMATPPAEEEAGPRPARAPSRSVSRVVTRTASGVLIEAPLMKDNKFMTVPAAFNPASQSPKKGKKREREVTGKAGGEDEKGSASPAKSDASGRKSVSGSVGARSDAGAETDPEELDLSFMPMEPMALGGERDKGSPPPRKKSKP